MSSTKLIVVLGATGNQGGSVVDSFINEPGWTVRAITRNTTSAKAKDLAARGAEVVQATIDEPSTLQEAFNGAHAIFAVSDFWGLYGDPANKIKAKPGQPMNEWACQAETQQLKNVIDAAAKVTMLERFVISSLSNATKWSRGRYSHVFHFDSKANAEEYAKQMYPDLWAKTSVYQAGLFLGNFTTNFMPRVNANGVAQFIGAIDPEIKLPFIAAEEDSGPLVKALVQASPGKNLIGYREWINMRELAETFARASGFKSEVIRLPQKEVVQYLPEDLRHEMADTFGYFNEFGYEGRDDPTLIHPKDLTQSPTLGSVEEYLKKQDWSNILGV